MRGSDANTCLLCEDNTFLMNNLCFPKCLEGCNSYNGTSVCGSCDIGYNNMNGMYVMINLISES